VLAYYGNPGNNAAMSKYASVVLVTAWSDQLDVLRTVLKHPAADVGVNSVDVAHVAGEQARLLLKHETANVHNFLFP